MLRGGETVLNNVNMIADCGAHCINPRPDADPEDNSKWAYGYCVLIQESATATINGGYYWGTTGAIRSYGTTNINGGTFDL